MNIKQLKEQLKSIDSSDTQYTNHIRADELLLEYINDQEVTDLFNKIEKWYA